MLVVSCSEYDDSSLWKQVDEAQKQIAELTASLTELESQIGLLSAAKNGGLITSIQENTDGGFTIKYTTSDGKEATAIIAGKDDIKSVDIIGTKEENGVLYWTITVGGKTTILTDTTEPRSQWRDALRHSPRTKTVTGWPTDRIFLTARVTRSSHPGIRLH